MCVLCVEIQKNYMTFTEVINAYKELEIKEDHEEELRKIIEDNYSFDTLIEFLLNQ